MYFKIGGKLYQTDLVGNTSQGKNWPSCNGRNRVKTYSSKLQKRENTKDYQLYCFILSIKSLNKTKSE